MAAREPLFSVVIPTYARPQALAACLSGLFAMDFPREQFEVIVADDGSPPGLEALVKGFHGRLTVSLFTDANAGPAAARNRGAAHASGRYLAFLDDDCVPDRGWLNELANCFKWGPEHLIAGRSVNALPTNPYSTATQLIVSYVHEHSAERRHGHRLFNTTNMAMPKRLFHQLGGFNTGLRTSEDYDFCSRWQNAGYPVAYAPAAIVHHAHELGFTTFCRQHYRYGRGLLRYRLNAGKDRQLRRERLSFYVNLLRFPLTQGRGARRWLHAALVGVSQAAIVTGIVRELVTSPGLKSSNSSPMQERGRL